LMIAISRLGLRLEQNSQRQILQHEGRIANRRS
jgi:hypothetical protein